MNNQNTIKLVNENGVAKEYGEIPDLWHLAMAIQNGRDYGTSSKEQQAELAEAVLQVWHMAHDMKAVVERQGQAALVSPNPEIVAPEATQEALPKDLGYVIELAQHRADMWTEFWGSGDVSLNEFHECDDDETKNMVAITASAVDSVSRWYRKVRS